MINKELKQILWRIIGLGIVTYSNVLFFKFFLRLNLEEASIYIGIYSYFSYIPLLSFGIGRPIYSELRYLRIIPGFIPRKEINNILNIYILIQGIAIVTILLLIYFYSKYQGYEYSYIDLLVFMGAIAFVYTASYYRDISYGVGCEAYYEVLEVFRKLILCISILMLLMSNNYIISGVLLIIFSSVTIYLNSLKIKSVADDKNFKLDLFSKIKFRKDATLFLFYTAIEAQIYNLPLIIISYFHHDEDIIYYSIWIKLFFALTIFHRFYTDSRVNAWVDFFYSGEVKNLKKSIIKIIINSFFIQIIIFFIFLFFSADFFAYLNTPKYVYEDNFFYVSLLFWLIGNVPMHAAGSFLISNGHGFKIALLVSFLNLLLLMVLYAFTINSLGLSKSLLLSGLLYLLSALGIAWLVILETQKSKVI